MKTYTFSAIQANGAVILRSSLEQDRNGDAREMLEAIRVKFPTARHMIDFRTFDGDGIAQFVVDIPMFNGQFGKPPVAIPSTGVKLTFTISEV